MENPENYRSLPSLIDLRGSKTTDYFDWLIQLISSVLIGQRPCEAVTKIFDFILTAS